MNHSPLPQTSVNPLGNIILFAGGTLAAAAAAWSAALGRHWFSVPACALCTLAALACFRQLFTQKLPTKNELCHHLLAAILLALAVDPQMVIWQGPKVWPEVLRITSLPGGFLIQNLPQRAEDQFLPRLYQPVDLRIFRFDPSPALRFRPFVPGP